MSVPKHLVEVEAFDFPEICQKNYSWSSLGSMLTVLAFLLQCICVFLHSLIPF